MNRTERAIKKQLRKVQRDKKREKNRLLGDVKDSFSYGSKQKNSMELKNIVSDEKKLKEWHRQIIAEGQKPIRNAQEVLTAF